MATAYVTKVTAIPAPPSAGDIFWVDGIHGLDANTGRSPLDPLKKIADALALCTADHDDYIYVMDCWQQEDTWPIVVNKSKVHIIGVANPNNQYPKMQPDGDFAVFLVVSTGQYSEIAGFDLSGGTNHGCIELALAAGTWIHDCWFGSDFTGGTPQDGIRFLENPNGLCLIENCRFFGNGMSKGNLTRYGIFMANVDSVACDTSEIRNCQFHNCPTGSIFLRRAIGVSINNNYFACDADTEGIAITLSSTYEGCVDCLVTGNRAIYGQDATAMAKNPYLDQNAVANNHWALNYKGNALIVPA